MNNQFIVHKQINAISKSSEIFKVIRYLIQRKKIVTKLDDFERRILACELDFATKKQLWGLQKEWGKQPFKAQRCTRCHLEIPGPQQVMIWHLATHFSNYTEHRSRIEQIETHPYRYI